MTHYRFDYASKKELRRSGQTLLLVASPDQDATYSLRAEEYELAALFDGSRTSDEVLEEFRRTHDLDVSREDFDAFVTKLQEGGLLRSTEAADVARAANDVGHAAPRAANDAGRAPVDLASRRVVQLPAELPRPREVPARVRPAPPRARPVRPAAPRTRSWRWPLGIGIVLVILGALPYTFEPGGEFAALPAQRADVRALLEGDIREIHVKEGDLVAKGQILAKQADDEERTAVATGAEEVAALEARLAQAEKGPTEEQIALARQRVATARTRADFSRSHAERRRQLFEKELVPEDDYERALSEAEVDTELLKEAQRDLDLLLAGTRAEEIEALRAELEREKAQLDYHRQRLAYTEIRAPIAGRIVSGTLIYAVGDYLEEGDLLATIEDTSHLRAEIHVPEADVDQVTVGADVRIRPWAYPGRDFEGKVVRIAPNAEPQEYGRIVRVTTEIDNSEGLLRAELTGQGKIRGETQPAFFAFTRAVWRFLRVELWSWVP
jgi:multidrug resistance efflux pump